MSWRNTAFDRARIDVDFDPSWLLAPLYARDRAGIAILDGAPGRLDPAVPVSPARGADLAAAWARWWQAAYAYRPGTPAPDQADLVASSKPLSQWWSRVAEEFEDWLAHRPAATDPDRHPESAALSGFAASHGREPAPIAVRILVIPVAGDYLLSPEPGRLIVSAALRADAHRYPEALSTALATHL